MHAKRGREFEEASGQAYKSQTRQRHRLHQERIVAGRGRMFR